MTKYDPDISHLDEDDADQDDVEADPRPRVETNTHSIVIDRFVDDRYIDRYQWQFAIEDRTVVGWTRSDIEHTGTRDYCDELTLEDMPTDVRVRLERELGVDDLDDHVDLPEHLRADPDDLERGEHRDVECVHCGATVLIDAIVEHHTTEHPDRRYDPLWYDGGTPDVE
ncbi:hypothetical protein RBH26_21115 [Natronolimnohabitans sp. A-GB9]|uniref:hypothetical protein n=1 Tax=Natronolimnohabitans sp. A-GB9 TaxID=3069757 RepID=UPI0027AF21D8|nr:hypothetical protein [Natronolimnohabitans sp. A-GB9]MDQ2052946.1 hypothetical protein [Natronolimnohabitans sp. A-GB9]